MNKYGLEARENWIQARIDELMDDDDWTDTQFEFYKEDDDPDMSWTKFSMAAAKRQAEKEHSLLMAGLEDERINQHRGHHEF